MEFIGRRERIWALICVLLFGALLVLAATVDAGSPPSTGRVEVTLRPGEQALISCEPEPELPPPPPSEYVLEMPSVVHVPTEAEPVRRIVWNPPNGRYQRVEMRLYITPAEYQGNKRHSLYWLVRDRNRDMIGYGVATASKVVMRHGMGLPQAEKPKVQRQLRLQPGETYELVHVYDCAGGAVTLAITGTDGTAEVLTLPTSVPAITFADGQEILLDLGFPGSNPNEPAWVGTTYRDLLIEVVPE